MAITIKLGRTLTTGVAAGLLLLGSATGVAQAQASAASRAPSTAAPAGGRSVPAPGSSSILVGAACASPGNCWAVGSYQTSRGGLNQALHWNGRRWSLVPTPTPGVASRLTGAACTSPGNCWAVGQYQTSRTGLNQALHWNGRRWSLVSTPKPGGTSGLSYLASVRCTSASDCWAVGSYAVGSGQTATLNQALHWNGRRWSLVPTPDPGGTAIGDSNHLYSIRCTSSVSCWAVGSVQPTGQNGRNQALQWDGTSWSAG